MWLCEEGETLKVWRLGEVAQLTGGGWHNSDREKVWMEVAATGRAAGSVKKEAVTE